DAKDPRRFRAAGATIVTPNLDEAWRAVEPGGDRAAGDPDPVALERLGRRLLELIDADHAAITLAERGVCLLARAGGVWHLPARPVPHAGDVGAGDTFAAALALALAAGADCVEAARVGIEAAGVAVTRQRTAVVEARELLRWVSLRDGAAPPPVAALAARLDRARLASQTVVFTNGVFDILHAGHVEFLRRAKALGDILVVGVNSDRSVRRLKGPGRPINGEHDRRALVAALDPVDEAVIFDEDTPSDLIRALRPHLHVKGGDYAGVALPEADAVREVGGRVVVLPLVAGHSTTEVIDRVLSLAVAAPAAGAGLEAAP
ncbi:MAG TPA: D-glycero-beta-D-manno-heptose 1-phosphate adenylyltransferase, partial [Thermomicrobiales bacterium]|nr:D-glycero-beta-D-manno-heptose 1-phosphate adenylyltransferase [Thermomicrobiales bacterium]